ncbi:Armadillo-like helical [Corchorus capsularis]|uniref:Armadillo-like helical n=1 Tax=Corchorus capsularis TaxID=210143 RepID=A0A1R3HDP1_COCAP|nr:Armadillo-like helical [Corchorus capsularis]
MSNSLPDLRSHLSRLTKPILDLLLKTPYTPEETTKVSTKSTLESLLSTTSSVKDFSLACALLSSSRSSTHELLAWIPSHLSAAAETAFSDLSEAYNDGLPGDEKRNLAAELMPEIVPVLKEKIKESLIDKSDEIDEVFAASARTPVGFAILAAYQFRWFVCQVEYPHLGKLVNLIIPCALTCLDHWSPEVKAQGMISLIHMAKNVNAADFGWYGDAILDACCHNIASADEIWKYVVEMLVLLVTSIERDNPRSSWFEKMLNEMLSHLERQPRDKERRIAWLKFVEPIFDAIGLVVLAHFRRIFPLFFQWMHVDDDETVLLVLKRIKTVIRLTWIWNSPYVVRLVDELVILFKESALKKAREEMRTDILDILTMLQQCKGQQFETAWEKHRNDPDLTTLALHLSSGPTFKAESVVEGVAIQDIHGQ